MTKTLYNKKLITSFALALVLAAVIAFSGCIGGDDTTRTYGEGQDALYLELLTDFTTYDSLEPFTIIVRVTNEGEFEAENVTTRLQGYDGITSLEGLILSNENGISPRNLAPPDVEADISGDVGDANWEVAAPFVDPDAPDRDIWLTGEVLYDHKSLVSGNIVAVTREYEEAAEKRGESIPTPDERVAVNGPVSIDIEIPDPYVRVVSDQTNFRLKIMLNNDGTGNVYNRKNGLGYDYLNKVTLKIPKGLGIGDDCDFVATVTDVGVEKTLTIDFSNNRNRLRLIDGGTHRDLHCMLIADSSWVGGYNQFTIDAKTEYTYIQSITKKLLVMGTTVSPLDVTILSPTSGTPTDHPWLNGTNEPMTFEVLYQNSPVTSGLNTTTVKIYVGGVEALLPYMEYKPANDWWEATVTVPDMGLGSGATGAYDIKVEVTYQDQTAYDTERQAVNYKQS